MISRKYTILTKYLNLAIISAILLFTQIASGKSNIVMPELFMKLKIHKVTSDKVLAEDKEGTFYRLSKNSILRPAIRMKKETLYQIHIKELKTIRNMHKN